MRLRSFGGHVNIVGKNTGYFCACWGEREEECHNSEAEGVNFHHAELFKIAWFGLVSFTLILLLHDDLLI